jgi:septum formation protein
MDKAGAYGIQGYGSQFIKRVSGCYFNVMGFPVTLFYNMLKRIL